MPWTGPLYLQDALPGQLVLQPPLRKKSPLCPQPLVSQSRKKLQCQCYHPAKKLERYYTESDSTPRKLIFRQMLISAGASRILMSKGNSALHRSEWSLAGSKSGGGEAFGLAFSWHINSNLIRHPSSVWGTQARTDSYSWCQALLVGAQPTELQSFLPACFPVPGAGQPSTLHTSRLLSQKRLLPSE